MEIKIPLARQEEEGRGMLLAGVRAGEDGKRAIRRNQGKKTARTAKGCSGAKAIGHASARSSGSKVKGGNGNRALRHGQSYNIRRAIREAKARNRSTGRSAQVLGITWLGSRCEDSPVSKAHHFIACTKVDTGDIYECQYCHKVKWMPCGIDECQEFDRNMQIYGCDLAYQKLLDEHPAAKRMIAKIQDIYYLRKAIKNDSVFHLALASIIMDREYPYDVEVEEEEML